MPSYSSVEELLEEVEEKPGENRKYRFNFLRNYEDWANLSSENFLKAISALEFYSKIFDEDAHEKVEKLGNKLLERNLEYSTLSNLHQTLANNYIDQLSAHDQEHSWPDKKRAEELRHLRKSLIKKALEDVDKESKCQKFVNFGNALSRQGRFIEAIRYYRKALNTKPNFPEAKLNLAIAKSRYGNIVASEQAEFVFNHSAYEDLREIEFSNIESMDPQEVARWKQFTQKMESLDTGGILDELEDPEISNTEQERKYREWVLENRLFLNALNDIDKHPAGATDPFHISDIKFDIDEDLPYPGLYNQMKQEFVSARYMYYDSLTRNETHFSDREVKMVNTLDYPIYSYQSEQIKASLRMSYSIFDKIAYFINEYLNLGIPEDEFSFNNIWFKDQSPKKSLRKEFESRRENKSLQSLYWLRTDFYWNEMNVEDSIDLVAEDLAEIRHQLEHKYLKVHKFDVGDRSSNTPYENNLKFSISEEKLEKYGLEMLKTARAGLIYLILAVNMEERNKASSDPGKTIGFIADNFDDDWKT